MTNNKYVPVFEAIANEGPFEFVSLSDQGGTLAVTLEDGKNRILELAFPNYLSYRKCDEGDALVDLSEISDQSVQARWFYEVLSSALVQQFQERTLGVREGDGVRHFLITAQNDVIDVLCLTPPHVSHTHHP